MISMLKIMIFGFFRILNRFEIMSGIKVIGIKCLSFGGVVKGLMFWGVGRRVFRCYKALKDGFMKILYRSCEKSMSKECSHFNRKYVENNSVNCPFSGHGVQNLDKTSPFSGHGVHFLDITKSLISLTLK